MENSEEILSNLQALLDYNNEDEETNEALEYAIECVNKIEAIRARIDGEFDNDSLNALLPTLSTDSFADIKEIIKS